MKKFLTILFSLFFLGCLGKRNKENFAQKETKPEIKLEKVHKQSSNNSVIRKIEEQTPVDTASLPQENRTLKDYESYIQEFSELKRSPQALDVEKIIPISDEEFGRFYSLSYPGEYPESNLDLYYDINEIMLDYAMSDKGNCQFLYSNLAEFVDGEYADSYFVDMDGVVKQNVDKFCSEIYSSLSLRSQERLREIYNEYCRSTN